MTAGKTTSTFVLVRDEHGFKGGAAVDCPCLHGLWSMGAFTRSGINHLLPVINAVGNKS